MVYVTGWLEWCGGESLIYTTEEAWSKGNPYNANVIKLSDITEEFANKKIKIIIEEI